MEEYSLSLEEADALTQEAPTGDLLDAAVTAGAEPRRCVNLLLGRGAALANERGCTIADVGVSGEQLAGLVRMLEADELNATAAAKVFDALADSNEPPRAVAEREGLLAVRDSGQIEQWVDEAMAANPQAVEDATGGGKKQKKAFGFLTGQVMQLSKGAAQPQQVQALLRQKLGL
jgi:aspartyl-tRNA(Asn)/glutamyl-tRNA(Gln) amidotransferase subunit B